ncbi:hypothetical protein BDQ12DRAFT_584080, partial [Crucibulum laeve]
DLTQDRMKAFFFHKSRPGVQGKGKRDVVKPELLRWHPDKFEGKVIAKILPEHRTAVLEAVGLVARYLT